MTDHRFFMIDDAALTLNRIDHYCNMFQALSIPTVHLWLVVDYVNIIRHEDPKDLANSQITIADNLKVMSS